MQNMDPRAMQSIARLASSSFSDGQPFCPRRGVREKSPFWEDHMALSLKIAALAAAAAWLAGHNQGTVTLFLSPYRIDLSLNLVLLVLGLVVLVVVLAQQALSALLSLPQQAQRWRLQQKEREIGRAHV
jgi:hypothetical protein